jgi:hypothetical protein
MAGPDHQESSSNMPTGGGTALAPEASTAATVARYVEGPGSSRVTSDAPDWSLVHFDVGCARCGHDLRGRIEPVCPACSLEFDWSQAVPLEELICAHCGYHLYGLSENRCPECGESFTWEAALADYHLRCKPWFEYQWTKTPVRSFIRTVSFALRPWRLWREMSIHDPPPVAGLLVLWLASAAVLVGLPLAELLVFDLAFVLIYGGRQWGSILEPIETAHLVLLTFFFLIIWNATILLTLLTMRWSLVKCKVRWPHVLRVCVYLVPCIALFPFVALTAVSLSELITLYSQIPRWVIHDYLGLFVTGLVACAWILTAASLGFAYRRYFKMQHAWGVAVAASVVGMLCLAIGYLFAGLFGIFRF